MNNLFKTYKPFILFLIKFFSAYLVLTFLYNVYLQSFDSEKGEIDGVSEMVAFHVEKTMLLFNQNIKLEKQSSQPAIRIIYNEKINSRIIEGCNAVSVMILFAAFVIAFSTTFLKTFLYVVLGVFIIHVLNVLRIDFLVWAVYNYPEKRHFLHGTVFPFIIYSVVFVLWIIWIHNYAKNAKK